MLSNFDVDTLGTEHINYDVTCARKAFTEFIALIYRAFSFTQVSDPLRSDDRPHHYRQLGLHRDAGRHDLQCLLPHLRRRRIGLGLPPVCPVQETPQEEDAPC